MTTAQQDVQPLLDRCNALGFNVRGIKGSEHYRVETPSGEHYVIKRGVTGLVVHTAGNATADALAALTAELDQSTKLKEQAEQERIVTKAKASAAHSEAVRRAAGPYAGPQEFPDGFYLDPHPAPRAEIVRLSWQQCERLLKVANIRNRPRSEPTVEKYAPVMQKKGWMLTCEGIGFDNQGRLIEGQHRMMAAVVAKCDLIVTCVVGLDPDVFKVLNTGRLRRPADVVALMAGGKPKAGRPSVVATMLRFTSSYLEGHTRGSWGKGWSNASTADLYASDMERFDHAAELAQSTTKRGGNSSVPAGPLAAALYLIARANGGFDDGKVVAFAEGLASGRKAFTELALPYDDPRHLLRELANNGRVDRVRRTTPEWGCLVIVTWNVLLAGERRHNLYFRRDQPVPRVATLGPGSAAPSFLVGEL